MNRYRNLGLLLLGALAFGRIPATAQERGGAPLPDTTGLTLVFIVFPDDSGAQQAITDLNQSDTANARHIQDYAVVSRGRDGKVSLQESPTQGKAPAGSPMAENAVNGVVAHWVGGGGGNAESQAGVSADSVKKMGHLLKPGTSALVAVTLEPYLPSVVTSLQKGKKTQVVETNVAAPGASNPKSKPQKEQKQKQQDSKPY
jgi:uncharacterized membrane protein